MEGPRVVPIVLIPRFTTFAGANVEYRTHAIAVTEYESIEVFVWRGDLADAGWSVTFAVEESMDQENWTTVISASPSAKSEQRTWGTLTKSYIRAWMSVAASGGDFPVVTAYAVGNLIRRKG